MRLLLAKGIPFLNNPGGGGARLWGIGDGDGVRELGFEGDGSAFSLSSKMLE